MSEKDPDSYIDVDRDPVATAYHGFLSITVHTLRHRRFDGTMSPTLKRELLERGTSVCLLPYDPKTDKVLLIRQFLIGALVAGLAPRPLQVVAGMVDKDESDETAVRREALEEAGCTLKRLARAQAFLPSPGGTSERIVAFCGEADLEGLGGIHGLPSEGEDIRVEVVFAEAAIALLDSGAIEAGPAVVILQWFARHRERLRAEWLR
ncbi:NUDIX domain-containing protein [Beijerinckia sp. L45]|uniref:NUDIX domain-containing protein n=1 Tax=Beijerinckia sp. L45 TaxID=1641855 RepID=UPI00131CD3B6|nr:NUDIX domain-containing protein [Beijerinckia sp. L45]